MPQDSDRASNLYRTRVEKCQDFFSKENDDHLDFFFKDVASFVPSILLQVLCETRSSNTKKYNPLITTSHAPRSQRKSSERGSVLLAQSVDQAKKSRSRRSSRSLQTSLYSRTSTLGNIVDGRGSSLVSESMLSPSMFRTEGAFMLADISGFCRLSEKLCADGAEGMQKLVKIINECFTAVLETIEKHGGDVQKFAGDALLITWLTQRFAAPSTSADLRLHAIDPKEAAFSAAACGLELANLPLPHEGLLLHIGISFGSANLFMIGGSRDEWHTVVAGSRMKEMGTAVERASPRQVVVAPECHALIASVGQFEVLDSLDALPAAAELSDDSVLSDDSDEGEVISRDTNYYRVLSLDRGKAEQTGVLGHGEPFGFAVPGEVQRELLESLLLFLPHTVEMELDNPRPATVSESEMRDVTVLFVSLEGQRIQSLLSGVPALGLVQECLAVAQGSLHRFHVMLRQFIVDDKGVVLIGALGVPGFVHLDDATRGVECALEICQQLNEINVWAYAGITSGTAFCGLVGSPSRHEYAIVGDVVNLAARLMALGSRRAKVAPAGENQRARVSQVAAPRPSVCGLPVVTGSGRSARSRAGSDAAAGSFKSTMGKPKAEEAGLRRSCVMCDESTFQRVSDANGVEFRKQDRVQVKGMKSEIQVYQVMRAVMVQHFMDPKTLVPLESETARVLGLYRQFRDSGAGSRTLVLGPMGSGKTSFLGSACNALIQEGAQVSYLSPKSSDIHRPFSAFVMLFWLISNAVEAVHPDDSDAALVDSFLEEEGMGHPRSARRSRVRGSLASLGASARRLSQEVEEFSDSSFVERVLDQWEELLTPDELLLKGEVCKTILQIQHWKVSDWRPMSLVKPVRDSQGIIHLMLLKLLLCPLCRGRVEGGMVIVLDNTEFVDRHSWTLLMGFLRKVQSAMVVFALPCTPAHLVVEPTSAAFAAEVRKLGEAHEVRIEPMEEPALARMLELAFPSAQLDPATVPTILSLGQGNPFICKELARSLIEEELDQSNEGGAPSRSYKNSVMATNLRSAGHDEAAEGGARAKGPAGGITVSGWSLSLEKAIIGRIDRRSKAEQHVLKVASVVGGEFQYELVREIVPRRFLRVSQGRTLLDNVLATLVRDALLLEQDRTYLFSHEMLRLTCYNLLMREDQISYHRQVAHWISSTFQDDLRPYFLELAQHLDCAQVFDKAAEYSLSAIGNAIFMEAFDEAGLILEKLKSYTRNQSIKKRRRFLKMCLRELEDLKGLRRSKTATSPSGKLASTKGAASLRSMDSSGKRNSVLLLLSNGESPIAGHDVAVAKVRFWQELNKECEFLTSEIGEEKQPDIPQGQQVEASKNMASVPSESGSKTCNVQ